MATLNTPKAFDKALIPSQAREDIESLVDYINQNFDQIIRAFASQITFDENFRGDRKVLSVTDGVPIEIDTGSQAPADILVSSRVGIRSTSFTTLSTGTTQITFKFDEALPLKTRNVTASSPFAIYETEGLSNAKAGDLVSVTGFGNKLNNGTFVVSFRTENLIHVYNPNAATESKPQFTGDREESKEVSLFILF